MSMTQTFFGVGIVSTALVGLLGAVLPETPDFMVVYDVTYSDGIVTSDRTIIQGGLADRAVTIVSDTDKPPVCKGLHVERGVVSMPLDVWVGDDGCHARLSLHPGKYTQYVTWTPRDGREPVVFIGPVIIE